MNLIPRTAHRWLNGLGESAGLMTSDVERLHQLICLPDQWQMQVGNWCTTPGSHQKLIVRKVLEPVDAATSGV